MQYTLHALDGHVVYQLYNKDIIATSVQGILFQFERCWQFDLILNIVRSLDLSMVPRPSLKAKSDAVVVQVVDPGGSWHHYYIRNDISIGDMKAALSRKSWWDDLPISRKCLYLVKGTRPYREVSNDCIMHRPCVLGNRPELMND